MASKRRNVRVKGPTNYSVESTDDEDDDDPERKKAKKKLREMMQEDSDAESDFEKEFGHDKLNLSESDSSDEEIVSSPAKTKKSHNQGLKSSYFTGVADNAIVDEDVDASQRLVALAGNLEAVKNVWKEKGVRQQDDDEKASKSSNPESSFDLEISKLLAQGEGESMDDLEDGELEAKPSSIANSVNTSGVEVTIAVPDNQRRKKQKKGFDVAAFIKREVSKSRRELFLLLHKTHYVCLLAHLTHLDGLLSSPLLKATGLSLVPLAHGSTPTSKLTILGLGALVSWLRGAIPVNKHDGGASSPGISLSALMRAMQTLLAMNNTELVLVFILICRSLGFTARLVLNFAILPLKPKGDGGLRVFESAKEMETVPRKRNVEEIIPPSKSKESLSSKLSKSASSLKKESQGSGSGKSVRSNQTQVNRKGLNKPDAEKKLKEGNSSMSNVRKRNITSRGKRANVRRPSGSDDEGEGDDHCSRDQEKEAKKEKRSLSAKLADAAKARLSPSSKGNGSFEENWEQRRSNKEKGRKGGSLDHSADSKDKDGKHDQKLKAEGKDRKQGSIRGEGSSSSGTSRQASNKAKAGLDARDYWAEVYLPKEKKWVVVDLLTGSVNHPEEIEARCSKPVTYCLAVNQGKIKDVTAR